MKDTFVNKKPRFSNNQDIGLITTYLTEQMFTEYFKVTQLNLDDYIEVIFEKKLEVVFIDSYIYEEDHSWYQINIYDILKELSLLDINIIIINNDNRYKYSGEDYFVIDIDYSTDKISSSSNKLTMPPVLDEKKYNPIDDKPKLDILYLCFGKFERTEQIQFLHKHFKPKREEIISEKITRLQIIHIMKKIKESKVLYLYYSNKVSETLLKYIEIASSLQNTTLILNEKYEVTNDNDYFDIINTKDDESNMNYIRAFSKPGKFKEISNIKKHRNIFLTNTLAMYNSIPRILNGEIEKNEISVSVVTSTKRKNTLLEYVNRMNSQNFVTCEIILLTHGFTLNETEKNELNKKSIHKIKILEESNKTSYGNCLNKCISNIENDYFSKIDDDDFYYSNYLIDNWIAMKYSSADIVGKHSQFVYLESNEFVLQRFHQQQYRYSPYVAGATIFCTSEFIRHYMFSDLPRAIDSDLLRRVSADNGSVYCGHPYEFCIFRDNDKDAHTWQVSDIRLLKSAKIHFYGDPKDTLEISNI